MDHSMEFVRCMHKSAGWDPVQKVGTVIQCQNWADVFFTIDTPKMIRIVRRSNNVLCNYFTRTGRQTSTSGNKSIRDLHDGVSYRATCHQHTGNEFSDLRSSIYWKAIFTRISRTEFIVGSTMST